MNLPLVSLLRPWRAVADCFFVYRIVSWRFLGVCVPAYTHILPISYLKVFFFMSLKIGTCRAIWIWVDFFFFSFKTSETHCALFSLLVLGKIGLDYFQTFMEAFVDDWTYISADGWSLMGCLNFLSGLGRTRLWAHESVCWLCCVYHETLFFICFVAG